METRTRQDTKALTALSLVPDLLIALAVMKLTDNEWSTFWATLGVLLLIYLLIWLKGLVWSVVVWRFFARSREVERNYLLLREFKMPPPERADEGASEYFHRLRQDADLACETRIVAAEVGAMLRLATVHKGLLVGMRVEDSWGAAIARLARG